MKTSNMKQLLKLNDIPKHQVHQVPEGYFDRLPMRIMARTAAQEPVADTLWLAQLGQPLRLALAPLLLLFVFVGIYLFGIQQAPQPQNVTIASLSSTEIVNYLDMYTNVETADLEEHLVADPSLTADFLNVSSVAAEEELYYYQLDDIDY